jgi:hypothetical protein
MKAVTRADPPARLPTLTEVLEWPQPPAAAEPLHEVVPDEALLTSRILAAVQQKVDLMLEYRLREALGPTLARAADLVIREAREELAVTLRDVVERAVAQELARKRTR